jgi:hypothetical protein
MDIHFKSESDFVCVCVCVCVCVFAGLKFRAVHILDNHYHQGAPALESEHWVLITSINW